MLCNCAAVTPTTNCFKDLSSNGQIVASRCEVVEKVINVLGIRADIAPGGSWVNAPRLPIFSEGSHTWLLPPQRVVNTDKCQSLGLLLTQTRQFHSFPGTEISKIMPSYLHEAVLTASLTTSISYSDTAALRKATRPGEPHIGRL